MDDYDRFYKYILILLLIDSKKIDVYMGYVLLLTITDICDILGDNKIRNTSIENIEKEIKEIKDNFDLTVGDPCMINEITGSALAAHAKNYNNIIFNTENHNNVITSDYAYDESDDAYDDCDDWDRDDYEYFLEVISRDSRNKTRIN
jgi:frataxin-like iron-binding protein CyaY